MAKLCNGLKQIICFSDFGRVEHRRFSGHFVNVAVNG